jgi:hypothetical protein
MIYDRQNEFLKLKEDPWFNRVYKRLTEDEIKESLGFINENGSKNYGEFEYTLNRYFLDRKKPKHWKEMIELIMISNRVAK